MQCLLALGRASGALESVMQILVAEPQNVHALQLRAEALRQEGFLEAALEDVLGVKRRARPGSSSLAAVQATEAKIQQQLAEAGHAAQVR